MNIFHTLPLDCAALRSSFTIHRLGDISRMFYGPRTHWVCDGIQNPVLADPEYGHDLAFLLRATIHAGIEVWENLITRPEIGRFGVKLEGAGKLRVFAIASPILQTLLRPLHDWVMEVLRSIPMDGTFNQLKPLSRLKGHKNLYSFDLKAATDLLPARLSKAVLHSLMGLGLANNWLHLMQTVDFRSPDRHPNPGCCWFYRFIRGQPLGYYYYWPVFTLTHHVMVWMAAERVYPGQVFKDYGILGDDIVIADAKVASAYRKVMEDSQAVISIEKSLISSKGACEFAKRFLINNHRTDRQDVSPVSVPLLKLCFGYVSPFVFKSLGCSLITSIRLRGGGYHVFSKFRDNEYMNPMVLKLSSKWRRHWLAMLSPSGLSSLPLPIWLAFPEKGVLTCYELGLVRAFFLANFKPRDLNQKAFEELRLFWEKDERDVLERIYLPGFILLHLRYLS